MVFFSLSFLLIDVLALQCNVCFALRGRKVKLVFSSVVSGAIVLDSESDVDQANSLITKQKLRSSPLTVWQVVL